MTQDEQVRGDIIKKALDSLDFLGIALKQALTEYVEKRGNLLDSEHSYTLKEIEVEIAAIFGEDASALLVKRVRRAIETLQAFGVVAMPVACLFLLSCAMTAQ